MSVIWRAGAPFGISSDRIACLRRSRAFASAVLLFSACLNVLGKLSVLRTLDPAAETAMGARRMVDKQPFLSLAVFPADWPLRDNTNVT